MYFHYTLISKLKVIALHLHYYYAMDSIRYHYYDVMTVTTKKKSEVIRAQLFIPTNFSNFGVNTYPTNTK